LRSEERFNLFLPGFFSCSFLIVSYAFYYCSFWHLLLFLLAFIIVPFGIAPPPKSSPNGGGLLASINRSANLAALTPS
jgi:hypothetical protein